MCVTSYYNLDTEKIAFSKLLFYSRKCDATNVTHACYAGTYGDNTFAYRDMCLSRKCQRFLPITLNPIGQIWMLIWSYQKYIFAYQDFCLSVDCLSLFLFIIISAYQSD